MPEHPSPLPGMGWGVGTAVDPQRGTGVDKPWLIAAIGCGCAGMNTELISQHLLPELPPELPPAAFGGFRRRRERVLLVLPCWS